MQIAIVLNVKEEKNVVIEFRENCKLDRSSQLQWWTRLPLLLLQEKLLSGQHKVAAWMGEYPVSFERRIWLYIFPLPTCFCLTLQVPHRVPMITVVLILGILFDPQVILLITTVIYVKWSLSIFNFIPDPVVPLFKILPQVLGAYKINSKRVILTGISFTIWF